MPAPSSIPFRAVLFDLDGTLIESAPDIARAVNRTLADHHRPPLTAGDVRRLLGDGATQLVADAFAATGPALEPPVLPMVVRAYLAHYGAQDADPACVYDGVAETLAALAAQGVALAVCTNKSEAIARKVLDQIGLGPRFGAVIGGDSLPVRKPDPEPLRAACRILGVTPAQAVMVGDNRNDVLAARAAGMPVVVVSYGYPRMPVAALGGDRVIDRFDHLIDTLARLSTVPAPAPAPAPGDQWPAAAC